MNLTDIMLFGNAINGGGSSSSGVKCVYFDHNNMDKYEKTVLHDGDTEIVYVKISDETPTYEEILRGCYAQNERFITDDFNEELAYVVANDDMAENAIYDEELDTVIIPPLFAVFHKDVAELGLSAGTYIVNPETEDTQVHFASLTWGFR